MSQVVKNNRGFLQFLAVCPAHQRQFLLRTASPQQLQSNPGISNSFNSMSPLFRRKIEFPWIYPYVFSHLPSAISNSTLSKCTVIISVCSFCFYRLFPIQKYICNERLLFTGKYVVFETSICYPEMILWPWTLPRYILVKGNNVDVSHTIRALSNVPDIGPYGFKDKRGV